MPEDKPELEKQSISVIEVNEWFTPFPDYENRPYETPERHGVERYKEQKFHLANIGGFIVDLWWAEELITDAHHDEKYLLILPHSEKIIAEEELENEQKKMETRPIMISVSLSRQRLLRTNVTF